MADAVKSNQPQVARSADPETAKRAQSRPEPAPPAPAVVNGDNEFGEVADEGTTEFKRTRNKKPNPLHGAVMASLKDGHVKSVQVGEDQKKAKKAEGLIRRAGSELGCKVNVTFKDGKVLFKARAE